MGYVRIDYNRLISVVSDEDLVKALGKEQGVVLVITGDREKSKVIFEGLKIYSIGSIYSAREMTVSTMLNKTTICSSLDWAHYMGLQLRCAYITRSADLDFFLKILSKCRMFPDYKGELA